MRLTRRVRDPQIWRENRDLGGPRKAKMIEVSVLQGGPRQAALHCVDEQLASHDLEQ